MARIGGGAGFGLVDQGGYGVICSGDTGFNLDSGIARTYLMTAKSAASFSSSVYWG
jgi:hypothetical protein